MCGGARYKAPDHPDSRVIGIGYGYAGAKMPVIRPGEPDNVEWVPWGRRARQYDDTKLPVTGWAKLSTIEDGGWDKWEPEFVKLAVYEFSEENPKDKSRLWFPIDSDKAIQALIAHDDGREILYVVTVPTPAELLQQIEHDRLPHLVNI